jgi:hypothetical protein
LGFACRRIGSGDAFVAVSAFLVHPTHRGIDRVPFDPMEAQLLEAEAGPHPDRLAGVAPAPGIPLADHEPADGGSGPPVDLVERDEADVRAVLGEDRPVQVVLALGAIEWILTAYTLAQVRLQHGDPYVRLVVILGGVALLTAVAAALFQHPSMRARFGFGGRGSGQPADATD